MHELLNMVLLNYETLSWAQVWKRDIGMMTMTVYNGLVNKFRQIKNPVDNWLKLFSEI